MNNPELVLKVTFAQCLQKTATHLQDVVFVLTFETKHDNSGTSCGRVCPDIQKASVEGHENPRLRFANFRKARIVGAAEILLHDARAVPSTIADELRQIIRQVFVDLELHAAI